MVWIIVFAIALIAEALSTAFISIWFAVGAAAALIADVWNAALWIEILVFIALSVVTLLFVRPAYRRYGSTHIVPTNQNALLGELAKVSSAINNAEGKGTVRLKGLEYAARSSNGMALEVGQYVVVERIEGVKLFVSELDPHPTMTTNNEMVVSVGDQGEIVELLNQETNEWVVKIKTYWHTAVSSSNNQFEVGDIVQVDRIEHSRKYISRIEQTL